MNVQPDKLQRTPLREDIEDSFKSTQEQATLLRNMINCKHPGSKDSAFREFNLRFDYFFGVSGFLKELNKDIVHECDRWFDTKKPKATEPNIIKGLSLFKKYSKELFNKGLIKY